MDRRTTLKWMLAASAALPLTVQQAARAANTGDAVGYGTDPDLVKLYGAGELWPLTFTPVQRHAAAALCDDILPADAHSPAASAVGVVDFLDEWVSAPYPRQRQDRPVISAGLEWLDGEARRRFMRPYANASDVQRQAICDDVCYESSARDEFIEAAHFFARFRDLAAGGYYTTAEGRRDIGYIGNVPLLKFVGASPQVVSQLGLATVKIGAIGSD